MKRLSKAKKKRLRQEAILAHLRDPILEGFLRPGDRLPSQYAVAEELGVTPLTVQRAFRQLVAQGFVRAEPNIGRFVADQLPHLTRYPVTFYSHPDDQSHWGGFARAMLAETVALSASGDRKLPCFFNLDGHTDSEDFQTLVRDIKARRMAGLIFSHIPGHLIGTSILDDPGIPRVMVGTFTDDLPLTTVEPDGVTWVRRAVDYMVSKGRRRIAAVFKSSFKSEPILSSFEVHIVQAMESRGLESRPLWRQYVDVMDPLSTARVVQLLMQEGQRERPDALLITDDTMFDAAVAGLAAAGVRASDDVEIVAHGNFPVPTASAMPIRRLGYPARQILETCIDLLDRQRCGEAVPRSTPIAPVFDDELAV